LINKKSTLLVLLVIFIGTSLRLVAASRGHNADIDGFLKTAEIYASGGNVYQKIIDFGFGYNYGPVWFNVLSMLQKLTPPFINNIELRWKIPFFLSLIDIIIFLLLKKRYGLLTGLIFYLNPISIIITGYHAQFDNLAILIGFLAVLAIDGQAVFKKKRPILGVFLLGASLATKHLLFLFPIWLAIKQDTWRKKLFFISIPYIIFFTSFTFYLPEGYEGILKNVFFYKSFNNAPFWTIFAPNLLLILIPKILLFVLTLFLLGFIWRKKSTIDSFYFYLVSLVVFSSAITNQYLSIPCLPIAVLWNWAYGIYILVTSLYLSFHFDGLHLVKMELNYGYESCILFLTLGLLISSLGKNLTFKIVKVIKYTFTWLKNEANIQLKLPW